MTLMRSKVDLGIIQTNAWQSLPTEAMRQEAREKVQYIAGLYTKDLHALARRALTDIRQLHQRKVNIGPSGSATNWTARQLFAQLGIEPAYEEVDHATALERLRGQIEAALLLERRPAAILRDLRTTLLSISCHSPLRTRSLRLPSGAVRRQRLPEPDRARAAYRDGRNRNCSGPCKGPGTSARQRRLARFTTRFFALFRSCNGTVIPSGRRSNRHSWSRAGGATNLPQTPSRRAPRGALTKLNRITHGWRLSTRSAGAPEVGSLPRALHVLHRQSDPPASTARGFADAHRPHRS